MPADLMDEEEQLVNEEGQAQETPPVRDIEPPETAPAQAPPIAPPGAVPIAPPRPRSPFLTPQEAQSRAFMRQVQRNVADAPYTQAEQAITSAMKFQAIRGYQNDLQEGMPAAQALVKWGPMMFKASPGSASAMVRAATPARPVIVGGRAYSAPTAQNPSAPLTPLTPEVQKQFAPRVNRFDELEFSETMKELLQAEKNLADPTQTTDLNRGDAIRQLRRLRERAEEIRSRSGTSSNPTTGGATPRAPVRAPAAAPSSSRIRVRRPDGKTGTISASQLDAALAAGYTRL